jgi:replicative DNA helicase
MKKVVIQSELTSDHTLKIEQLILGAILIDQEAIHVVARDFQIKLFDHEPHQIIAEAIIKLHLASKPIDLLTLTNLLIKEQSLERIGGVSVISNLTTHVGGSQNIEYHLRLLQEFWLKKYISEMCSTTQLQLIEYKRDVFDVYADMQNTLDNALKEIITKEIAPVNEIHLDMIKSGYEIVDGKGTSGVPTGLQRFDILTNGFQPSDLVILAGRTSMGKTALSISILIEPCINQKIPVAVFSLEMSKEQLVGRVQSILSKVNVSKIVKKQLTYDEITHIHNRCKVLSDAPMYIDDSANISLLELKSKSRKLVREKGVKMIVIDYLQLMRSGLKTNSREQEVAEISKGLKAIAKELNIPVIALSQLSRGVEQRQGSKKPMLSDLRDSGQIEQDADMVLFCFRPEYYTQTEYDWFGVNLDTRNLFMLIVAKHRNGVLGEIPLNFFGEHTHVTNHSDTYSLYPSSNNESTEIPSYPKLNSIETPDLSYFNGANMPRNTNFESNNESTKVPEDNANNEADIVRLPYKDNDILDNPPF